MKSASLLRRDRTGARPGFSDLLQYGGLENDGIVMLKDGAMLAGFWYEGRDLETARDDELHQLRAVIIEAFHHLDSSWMIHTDGFRRRRRTYIAGSFANATDQSMDEERADNALSFEMHNALWVTWRPPLGERVSLRESLKRLVSSRDERAVELARRRKLQKKFETALRRIEETAGGQVAIARMRTEARHCQLQQALNFAVNGEWLEPCRPPKRGLFLDTFLAHGLLNDGSSGEVVFGGEHVAVVSLRGYPARGTELGDFTELERLPFEFRWNHRFIVLGYDESRSHFSRVKKTWEKMRKTIYAQLSEDPNARINKHADQRVAEVEDALDDIEAGDLFGHHTCSVVVRAETRELVLERAKQVVAAIKKAGYQAAIEADNAMEAWLGTFPGHGYENVRKGGIKIQNLADMLQLSREWRGEPYCPSPFYARKSPPLMQVSSWSRGLFWLNLHAGDTPHTMLLGPTGAGKSTALATLASQFGRYPGSQVFAFDNGNSMMPLCLARPDGVHYRLAADDMEALAPLASIDGIEDRAWTTEWVEGLFEQLRISLSPEQRTLVREAVDSLAESTSSSDERTLTALRAFLQDRTLQEAFKTYTSGAAGRVLNGKRGDLRSGRFTVFDIELLMKMGPKVYTPTLLYLFREVERRLDGSPTMIIIDEAWVALQDARFSARLEEWLRTLRRKNAAVIFASQSLGDVARSPIRDILLESCPTRIFLPNFEANTDLGAQLYGEVFQLRSEQIRIVGASIPKLDYLFVQRGQSRAFRFDLGPVQKSFVGASGSSELARVRQLYAEHGYRYAPHWLEERGLPQAAARWRELDDAYSASEEAA
jgi:type IV secretion/conjugal transfer VirB4 family ATPase